MLALPCVARLQLSRALEECAEYILPSDVMPMSLKCAMVGLEVEHKEANRSVLSFLEVCDTLATPYAARDLRDATCSRGVAQALFALGVSAHAGDEERSRRLATLIAPVLLPEAEMICVV